MAIEFSEDDEALLRELQSADERRKPSYDDIALAEGQIVRVRYLGVEVAHFHKREKWYARFVISEEGRWHGHPILRAYNAPQRKTLARSHHLFRDWTEITALRPPPLPRKRPALLDALFKGCELHARTRLVRRDQHGGDIAEADWYSVIDGFGGQWEGKRFSAIAAGCPFVLSRKRTPGP